MLMIRQCVKKGFQETLGRLGLLESGEDLFLEIRRAFTPLGKVIYEEREKRVKFYGQFIKAGNLCFDVGANFGTRIEAFLRLGARVVAVEPQKDVMRYLTLKYSDEPRVMLIRAGLDQSEGERQIYICETTRGASSMSPELVEIQQVKHPNLRYENVATVSVTTMDRLVEQYGVPDFCKIDVEGFEYNVLKGLSQAVPQLSFEYTPERIQPTLDCIDYLAELGRYEYNYSLEESMVLANSDWLSPMDMSQFVKDVVVPDEGLFGDIYARMI